LSSPNVLSCRQFYISLPGYFFLLCHLFILVVSTWTYHICVPHSGLTYLFAYLLTYLLATGHFVWLVRLPGTVSHWTFIPHRHYQLSKTCSKHICSLVPTSLTNCFAEYEQRALYGALVLTLAMLLRLINCFIIIVNINNIIIVSMWKNGSNTIAILLP